MYITVLDYNQGDVYQYNATSLCNDDNWSSPGFWNIESESCISFLEKQGHVLNNCEWMVHKNGNIITN